jgi:hypothetical protein
MNRRDLLSLSLPALVSATGCSASAPRPIRPVRTEWSFKTSQGLDAIAFLGPLSGKAFYRRYYEQQVATFAARLHSDVLEAIASTFAEADADGYLLWPQVALIASGGRTDTLQDLITELSGQRTMLREAFRASPYWSELDWAQFDKMGARLHTIFTGFADAGFDRFWRGFAANGPRRVEELTSRFATVDVIAEVERMVGRRIEPRIELNLLWFCRPHGVKLQGQRFIAQADAADSVFALTAAHEPLHPPIDMSGPVARRCIEVLSADPLIKRILTEKNKDTGYNSVEGLFEEGTVQAIDQIVQERLGFARAAALRWRTSDQGMHVVAAGLYGMLKADGYDRTGGHLEQWLGRAVAGGRLAPDVLHLSAAAARQQPVDQLWVVSK